MKSKIDILRYKSGPIKRIGNYLNETKHGQWVFFFESGIVQWIGTYKHGREIGIWQEWYNSGQRKEECRYRDGEKIAVNFWDEEGRQTLKDGTGYTYEKFGANDNDVYKHHYENGVFKSEERISKVSFGNFIPNDKEA